ncbi:MAG: hypothetical protein IPI67_15320 [Myxococcales bacterium]|nr:hypothetical protein [Myxococcales bacterium]
MNAPAIWWSRAFSAELRPGFPVTACVNDPALGGAACARRCTSASNQSECPANSDCTLKPKLGSTISTSVCLPN